MCPLRHPLEEVVIIQVLGKIEIFREGLSHQEEPDVTAGSPLVAYLSWPFLFNRIVHDC